jgi:protein TonB
MAAQREAAVAHPYGADELKLLYTHHLSFGLSSGIGLILACIVLYCVFFQLKPVHPKKPDISIPIEMVRPPTLYPIVPSDNRSEHSTIPKKGIPVPVPDPQANPNEILADQKTLSLEPNTALANPDGGNIVIQAPPTDLTDPDPNMSDWRPVELLPRVVHSVTPVYPELARLSGMEGKVVVKVLVDKAGKVRKAAVLSTDGEIFNQSALDAAEQYLFTPGMMNNGPVKVWVALRFEFKIR